MTNHPSGELTPEQMASIDQEYPGDCDTPILIAARPRLTMLEAALAEARQLRSELHQAIAENLGLRQENARLTYQTRQLIETLDLLRQACEQARA
jgi:hypothetical protein